MDHKFEEYFVQLYLNKDYFSLSSSVNHWQFYKQTLGLICDSFCLLLQRWDELLNSTPGIWQGINVWLKDTPAEWVFNKTVA